MSDTAKAVSGALSIVQILQAGMGLIAAAKAAMESGQTSVSKEKLKAHLANLDIEIAALEEKVSG